MRCPKEIRQVEEWEFLLEFFSLFRIVPPNVKRTFETRIFLEVFV